MKEAIQEAVTFSRLPAHQSRQWTGENRPISLPGQGVRETRRLHSRLVV